MVSGTKYTFSVYIKNIDATSIKLLAYDGVNEFSEFVQSQVNTSTWSRVSFTFTALNTTSSGQIQIGRDLPDGESMYIYGAQVEELSYATSYIPTYGAVRTRLQDTVSGAGTVSDFNSEEGVLFFEGSALANDLTNRYISINDGTTANSVRFYYSTTNQTFRARYYVGGTAQCSLVYVPTDLTQSAKIAFKWKVNDFSLWVNGVEVHTDNIGTVNPPNTFNVLDFEFINIEPFFAKTSQVQVFKTALSDAELILLTS